MCSSKYFHKISIEIIVDKNDSKDVKESIMEWYMSHDIGMTHIDIEVDDANPKWDDAWDGLVKCQVCNVLTEQEYLYQSYYICETCFNKFHKEQ